MAVAQRHEVDQRDGALGGFEARFQDQRVAAIAAGDACAVRRCGAISQRPCSGVPSSAAKQASESKRGQHSQSIEPSRPTSAARLAVADQGIVLDAQGGMGPLNARNR